MDCNHDLRDSVPNCAEPVQDVKIKSFVAHPDYSKYAHQHDIGLVQLKTAANFQQNNIKPICLPFAENLQALPDKFIVIGWGATENSIGSEILQKALVPLFNQIQCQRKYPQVTLIDEQFCAGGKGLLIYIVRASIISKYLLINSSDGIDACTGDSGSSASFTQTIDHKPRMVQYGIVSFGGSKCGGINSVGVYAKVVGYLEWILDNMKPT